jgi:hypothetical protein
MVSTATTPSAIPSLSAAAATLFGEGVPDRQIPPPSDEELDESEPSLDELFDAAPKIWAKLVSFLNELDTWCSLMKHHRAAKDKRKKIKCILLNSFISCFVFLSLPQYYWRTKNNLCAGTDSWCYADTTSVWLTPEIAHFVVSKYLSHSYAS